MLTNGSTGPFTDDSDSSKEVWDWRQSVWERLTDQDRVRIIQLGIAPGLSLLNQIAFGACSEQKMTTVGKSTLYRFDTLEHTLSTIRRRKLWLARPTKWEDPWEDPVWRLLEGSAKNFVESVHFDCFALCWTLTPSCEAHWHRLKGYGHLVRIETTVERFLSSLKIPHDDDIGDIKRQVFLRPIQYLNEAQKRMLKHEVFDALSGKFDGADADLVRIASLFAKRDSFDYEKEVRLVFRREQSKDKPDEDHYELDLDPQILIKSVQVDPWCGDYEYQAIQKTFKDLGYSCSKSDLAQPIWDIESSIG